MFNDHESNFCDIRRKKISGLCYKLKARTGVDMANKGRGGMDRGTETYRNMRVSGISFRICGRENGVNQHKGAHNLSSKPVSLGVAMGHTVGTTAHALVKCRLEAFHNPRPTNGSQALTHDVEHQPWKCHLSCQK